MDKFKEIRTFIDKAPDKDLAVAMIRKFLHEEYSSLKSQPIDLVRWVPIEKVIANDYNPNAVASKEMQLLYTSIKHDGYTQPIVTVYDKDRDVYVIVDGFHRRSIADMYEDIRNQNKGCVPIVVIQKDINDRMASTVRHNRARGKHAIAGMSSMVFNMLDNGWEDHQICNELGMEPEELLRLKHITGFSKLFEDTEYSKAWKSRKQIKLEKENGVLGEAK